jgi:Domain of unknown function (DUF4261)
MALAMSMILLREDAPLSLDDLQHAFRTKWPDASAPADASEDGTTLSFRTGSADIIVARMPAPIPWSDLEGPCATSILWPKAAEDLKQHAAHDIVTVTGDLNPIELAVTLTKATASVLSTSPTALGVYWGGATLLIPKKIFIDFAEEVLPLGPPLHIWVDFRVGKQTGSSSGGFTSGMTALGFMEFEVAESPEKPAELRERLTELARYLVEKGPVIKDGDSVGRDAEERIRVVYTESIFGHTGLVMRLEYEPSQPKPWWKVW